MTQHLMALPACVPPEGAEDGSLHWVEHPRQGLEVWRWFSSPTPEWLRTSTGSGSSPVTAHLLEWNYRGQASPTDATDLAAARAENAKLAAEVKDAWDTMDALGNQCREKDATIAALNDRIRELEATHAAQIASANVLIEQQKAALQEIEKEAWGLTVGMFVMRRIARAALGQSARAGGE